MGRAIVRDPSAFLMDEPLSNLDAKLRVQMRTEVSRIQQRLGTTTVYVTHDQTEAMTLGDRVAVMRAGQLQQVDTPKKLYEEPINLFVAGFIGSPAMNFFSAEIAGDTLKTPFGDVPLPDAPQARRCARRAAKRVLAGLRPESFEDAEVARRQNRRGGHEFEADVDLTESMGSEVYAYLRLEGDLARGRRAGRDRRRLRRGRRAGRRQRPARRAAERRDRGHARVARAVLDGQQPAAHLRRRDGQEPGARRAGSGGARRGRSAAER